MKIIQQNLDRGRKEDDAYAERLLDLLLGEDPAALLLSEFCPALQQDTITRPLEERGYTCAYPLTDTERYKHYAGYDCVCLMAFKETAFSFEQARRPGLDRNDLRYIEGTLRSQKDEGFALKLFFTHVSNALSPSRLHYKRQMLSAALGFWRTNRDACTLIAGDFNTEPSESGNTSLSPLFRQLYDDACDTIAPDKRIPTWANPTGQDKRLDYALASQALLDCGCSTDPLKTESDHLALVTTLGIAR